MKVFGLAGWSGSGKTTLLEKLIPVLISRGLRVSTIKQTHHDVDLDQPGKDSWRHRAAGATEILLTSSMRWALLHELRSEAEPSLTAHLQRLSDCDLVLVEGFKKEPLAKLEIYRPSLGKPLLHPDDPHIVGLASDVELKTGLPRFDIDDPQAIAGFIIDYLELDRRIES